MVWWGLWFLNKHEPSQIRAKLLAAAIISMVAIFVGRTLSMALPFRLRPIHNPEIEASLPINVDPFILDGWSSLPSGCSKDLA
jgi:undecaprenyl-diphosphatase